MKKTFIALLMCVSLFFCVCCSTVEPEIVPEYETEYTVDISGLTFIHGSNWNHELCDEIGYSSASDKVIEQVAKLKETYNCTYKFVKWEDSSSTVLNNIAAGIETVDFLDSHADTGGYALYRAGALYALEDIPGIDPTDEKWGTPGFLQYGNYNGKQYGFYQYAWEFMPEYAGILLFNGELLLKMGLNYPYEYQENGQWTWKNFRTMLETIQSNTSMDYPIYPYMSEIMAYDALGLIFTNGGVVAEQDETGKYVSKIADREACEALDFIAGLHSEKLFSAGLPNYFSDSRVVFYGCESYKATHHYSSDDYFVSYMPNFGFIQLPYGPSGSPELASGFVHAHRRLNWIINANFKEPEEIGIVMNFMYSPIDDAGGWKTYAESQIFHHYQGYENYAYQLENINYNYSVQAPVIKTTTAFSDIIMGGKSSSEALESLSMNIQAALDSAINNKN